MLQTPPLQRRGSETWALRTLVAAGWCVPSCALRATTPNPSSEDEGLRVYTPDCKNCIRRSEEHTSELQSLMRISYAVFCLKKKKKIKQKHRNNYHSTKYTTTFIKP